MREIRMSGSEGGGIETNRCFLPLYLLECRAYHLPLPPGGGGQ
jgi:hypothetical protein